MTDQTNKPTGSILPSEGTPSPPSPPSPPSAHTLFKDANGAVSSKRVMAFILAPCALAATILCIFMDPNSAGVVVPTMWGTVVGLLGVTVLEKKNGR